MAAKSGSHFERLSCPLHYRGVYGNANRPWNQIAQNTVNQHLSFQWLSYNFEKKTMGERSNVPNSDGFQAFIWGWGREVGLGLGDER